MATPELRFRQVHLDFHTSEHIAGIGASFSPEDFAATLERAHVDSITCFGRCHHGWMYFNTQAFPERRHPHCSRDLLREQIAACHARGIRVPIYTTIQWDHQTATEHPEWLVVDEKGAPRGTPLYEAGFYRTLCVNTPYRDFLQAHVRDMLETLPVDGFFFDIVSPQDCSCRWCRQGMEAEGRDPADAATRRAYGRRTLHAWQAQMSELVRRVRPDATIFYNSGHIGPRHRAIGDTYSHYELESLPSGGWGYLHFPVTMRYARTLGLPCLGMTGKFHTSWGDFNSFKTPEALQFECFRMLALGAQCSVGDQLPPSGRIDPDVYDLIGGVYREVEKKEPWCRGARPLADIGLFTPEAFGASGRLSAAIKGATRILEEGGHQFDIIDGEAADLRRYRLLILPDEIPVAPELATRLEAYLAQGGALVATFRSGLSEARDAFALEGLGVALVGDAPYSPDFLVPRGPIARGLPQTEHVMYQRGLQVEALPGTEVLADVAIPYFNRTYQHFCSHRHTPSSGTIGYPGIVRRGGAIYFAHPIFSQYSANAPRWCRRLLLGALDILLPDPLVRHDGPSTLQVAVNAQGTGHGSAADAAGIGGGLGRTIVHLLHYVPERRGEEFDTIEDVIPLRGVRLSLRAAGPVHRVACVPEGGEIPFEVRGGRVEFTVAEVVGHQMVEVV